MDEYWSVEFSATNNDYECACPGLVGTLYVRAKDIFDALDKAKAKVKTFGFDNFVINRASNGKYEEEHDDQ